jgi:hypothetical protein
VAFIALALFALGGCASSGAGGGESSNSGGNRIENAELMSANVSNAHDAVARLRPLWLQYRAARSTTGETVIVVAVNGVYFGDVESLREFAIETVESIRYLDSGATAAEIRGVPRGATGVAVAAAIDLLLRGTSPGTGQ